MERKQLQPQPNSQAETSNDLISLDNSNINTNMYEFDSSIAITPIKTCNPCNNRKDNDIRLEKTSSLIQRPSLSFTLCEENNNKINNNEIDNTNALNYAPLTNDNMDALKGKNIIKERDISKDKEAASSNIDYMHPIKRVNITENINILNQDDRSCNISFFNDQSMNAIVKSYLKNSSEQNISILDCVDVNTKDESMFYFIVDQKIASTIKEIYDLLGLNCENIELNQKGIEAIFNNIKLRIKIGTKICVTEDELLKENITKVNNKQEMKNSDESTEKIKVLENELRLKNEEHINDQTRLAEYRRIENSLRNEIDELYKKLNFEQCMLKHAEDKAKNLEYKNKLDNNTFIVDNIERLGNISKENANDYLAEMNAKNEELLYLKKQNRIYCNKLSDMEIVVDGLMNKLKDKKEREIDEEIDNDNSKM